MSAEEIREMAKSNEPIAAKHQPFPSFSEFPDQKAMLVLSCMDPRSNPTDFWSTGTAAIVRVGGGRATDDALRSMRLLAGIMSNGKNTLGGVAVVHHTDCGLRNFSDHEVAQLLKQHAGLDEQRAREVDGLWFGSWKDEPTVEDSVRTDMEIVKNDPYLPKDLAVLGYVYDIKTGKTTEVGKI